MSALLFILACEILSLRLKKCETISGIKIGSYESVICQYADDTTLTLGDKNSMKNAIQLINKFTQVSELTLNIQKSIGIWLGPLKNGPNLCEGISFTQDPVKFKDVLSTWNNRKLTYYGNTLVLNNLAIPKLMYTFTLLPTPTYTLKSIETEIYLFYGDNESNQMMYSYRCFR